MKEINRARKYLDLIASECDDEVVAMDADVPSKCRSDHPETCKNHGNKNRSGDGRKMRFQFRIGGVNSYQEDRWFTAVSFMKAIDEAREYGCNGWRKWKKNVWVKPLVCDGYVCNKNVIIDGDESLRSSRIVQFDQYLKSDFRRKGAGGVDAGSGVRYVVREVPVSGAEQGGADGVSSQVSGEPGHGGDRDHASNGDSEPRRAGRGPSGSSRGGAQFWRIPAAPEPPARRKPVEVPVQQTFTFDGARGKVAKYLSLCHDAEVDDSAPWEYLNSLGIGKTSGRSKERENVDFGIAAEAQDGKPVNLKKHDDEFHGGDFDPDKMSCKLRDEQKKEDECDCVNKCPPEERKAVIEMYKGTDKWMKAPNGEPTNLTERQWVQARTPSFEKCFGDWEKHEEVGRVTKWLFSAEPIVCLKGDEFGPNGEKLTDKVPRWFDEECGGMAISPEFGPVLLDREGVKDDLGHKMTRMKACAFAAVPDVIQKGKSLNKKGNWKNRGWSSAIIAAPIRIDKDDYICEVIIKDSEKRQGLYLHRVDLLDKYKLSLSMDPKEKNDLPKPVSQNIIAELAEECREHPLKGEVDENGEPKGDDVCMEDSAAKRYLALCQDGFGAEAEAQDETMKCHDISDEAAGEIARCLEEFAEDEWVDSGDGNIAWKPRKKGARRKPIDRVPKRRIHEIIAENVSLIKTVDKKMLPWVAKNVYRLLNGKMYPDELVDWLMEECDLSEGRAGLIACDQVRKATERIKVEDWKNRGIEFAMWKHTDGEKDPREYHMTKWDGKSGVRNGKPNGLDGFVFRLDKPPVIDKKTGQRGLPSTLIGCKCYLKGVKA